MTATSVFCPICASHTEPVLPLSGWGEIRKCKRCGLFFANPMVLPASPEELFSNAYRGEGQLADFSNFAKKLHYRAALLRVRRYLLPPTSAKTINWLRRNLTPGATVMEIGCGPGYFMHTLRRNGFNSIGIEPGEVPASLLKQEGFQVWHGTLDNYPTSWPVPSAVTCFFMLHHLPDPRGFFATLRRRFPRAALILSESHNNTLLFATKRDLPGSLPPRYFTWWTGNSLEQALIRAGFDATVLEIPYTLSGLASSLATTLLGQIANLSSFTEWLIRGKPATDREWASSVSGYPTTFWQRLHRFTGIPLNLWAVALPTVSAYPPAGETSAAGSKSG